MPTLQQLPQATTVSSTDQVLVEKDGVAFVSDVATLLADTQPLLTFAPNTLAGRTNPTVAGGPQPVQIGAGLTMQSGQLIVDTIRVPLLDSPGFTGLPTAPTRPILDASTALATTAFVQANVARSLAITLTGDISGTGLGIISTTLPTITTPGSYSKVQVNAKGQVVSGGQLGSGDVAPLLPTATTSSAGMVKIGSGLVVQAGQLSVDTASIPLLDSPAFTGVPTAPTRPTLDASTALATTAFVQANLARGQAISLTGDIIGTGLGSVPVTLPAITTPGSYSKVQVNAKGQVVSGSQLGSGDVAPLLPTATTSSAGMVKIGSGLVVQVGQLSVDTASIPLLDSPAFTGVPTAPTRPTLDASTALATTAFVQANLARGQAISLTGDIIGTGLGSVPVTLPAITTPGSYSKVQVNAKGQVVSGSQLGSGDVAPLLPTATTSSAGVVKIGSGLVVQPDGTVTVNTGLRTVQDFGAVGDGVTDDTAAFVAYGAWLRQQRSVNGAQQSWVLGFGRRYILNDTLDFTQYKYITFDGQGSQIISNVRGFAVIDGLGMENCTIRDLQIYSGSPNSPALIGLQLGMYIDNQGHPQNSIENVVITGYYSQACVFNAGSETCLFTNLKMVNRYIGSQWCYALIQDATGFWPIVSKYVATARTPNAAMSFNENTFIEPVVEMYGGGPAVWMSATHRHSYRGGYMTIQTGFPAAVLNFLDVFGAGHSQSLLEWDVHAEIAPTSIFLLTGYASPKLSGLLVRDHLIQAKNIFATTSDVSTVTILDATLETPDWYSTIGAQQSVFDIPSKYSVQGKVYINSQFASVWAAPAQFVGSLFSDNATPFNFGVGTVFAQSPTLAKIAGPLTLTDSLVVGSGGAVLGTDRVNPNIGVGYSNSNTSSYMDFFGANLPSYSIRMTMQAANQLTVTGSAGGAATILVPNGLISGKDFTGTGTLTVGQASVSGSLTAGTLVLAGAVGAAQVLAGPASGSSAPTFRLLAATDVIGVEKLANKAAVNGYASLDSVGKVPVAQLPAAVLGGLIYQGGWDAAANSPSLTSGVGTKGSYYSVSTGGSTGLNGITQWSIGDHAVFNGASWEKFSGAAVTVLSVAGRTGVVSLSTTDIAGLAAVATSGQFPDLISVPLLPASSAAGIVRSDGSAFGTVTIGGGLAFASGTLSTSGVAAANNPTFTGNARRSAGTGLAAAGTTQATATALVNDLNEVVTVSSGSNSVLLPDPGVGAEIIVRNAQGSSALLVYPPTGQSIDIGAANNPLSMGANSTKTFRKMSNTKWYSQ